MFCENCGKQILEESKFCKFCGFGVVKDSAETSDNGKQVAAKNKPISMWDKFAEIYDSKGDERAKYNNLSSNEAWELINRIGKNTFESFIEENKEQLNKQPYKVLENLESTIKYAVIGGYWLWMTENILKNGDNWKLKPIILDNIIKEWTESIKGLSEFLKELPQDLDSAIGGYQNFKVNSFLENSPSVKELPTEFIDKIKFEILSKILWGYMIGVAESKYIA